MIYHKLITILFAGLLLVSCSKERVKKRKVLAIPVYGQSLALGEEAIRVTNFDSLIKKTRHLVVTENLDNEFGYFSDSHFKQKVKKVIEDRDRSFELSIYGMSELVTEYFRRKQYGDSVMICTFPGGQGATGIEELSIGSKPYIKFLEEITRAYEKARENGWDFVVPAFCWMQGENDIAWGSSDYKKKLKTFQINLSRDIKAITKQSREVVCISYQTNCLSLVDNYDELRYDFKEASVPQGQLELIRDDPRFMASGPTYPYNFVRERVHIDGQSQKRLGYLAGLSVIRLLESKPSKGLVPMKFSVNKNKIFIKFNIVHPPLVIDTLAVRKASNFGFSVINSSNTNILEAVTLKNNVIELKCRTSPIGSKIRYAVNGVKGKSGNQNGPRGNLRDSQGIIYNANINGQVYALHNWCYQFDVLVNESMN